MKYFLINLMLTFCLSVSLAAEDVVRIATHGESKFARVLKDGTLEGSTVDALGCSMEKMGLKFSISVMSIARANVMSKEEQIDIFFPAYLREGPPKRFVGPIGNYTINWYMLNGNDMDPQSEIFKSSARVASIPGSFPETYLREGGYQLEAGSDTPFRLLDRLIRGKIDAFLVGEIDEFMTVKTSHLMKGVKVKLHKKRLMSLWVEDHFNEKNPEFYEQFQAAFTQCLNHHE